MDLRAQNRVLSHLAPFRETGVNLTGTFEPQRVLAGVMQAEGFAALGVRPVAGTLFTASNERDSSDAVVVLGHGLWQSTYGGDRAIIGKQIEVNGRKRTVLGIMPPRFAFPSENTQLWLPLVVPERAKTQRQSYSFLAIGRIKPGVSLERARNDMATIAKRLEQQYPRNRDYGVYVNPLPHHIVGDTLRTALWIMLGAVAAVLLIACANVANLLLSRAAVREREVTVRLALGASRQRLTRQLLTESVLLSAIGGAAGVFLAWAGLRALRALAPADLPRVDDVGVNPTVLIVTSAVTILTGLFFGLVPALQSSRATLSSALREGGRSGTSGRGGQRLRRTIVGAQIALVVVLLTGAGLLIRTFITLQRVQLGFETKNVLTVQLQPTGSRFPQPSLITSAYDALTTRLGEIPGVMSAGAISTVFLSKTPNSGTIYVEGRPNRPDDIEVCYDVATPGFFKTIGARLIAGRLFDRADRDSAPQVAVINEHMAKSYWPGVSAIGKRYRFGDANTDSLQSPWITVIGIVADMRRTGLDMPVRDEMFAPLAQGARLRNLLLIKTSGDPMALVPRVREALRAMDPQMPIGAMRTMDQELSSLVAQRRFNMTLVAAFAALALVLAVIGAYGVTSYLVSQRTREIGVRLALGADPRRVTRLVVWEGMQVAVAGVVVGVVGAILTTRMASSLLYGVSPRDPATITAVALLLLGVAAIANYLPARRAARVDPLVALREE
jgi:putative ABC transport system permease protein